MLKISIKKIAFIILFSLALGFFLVATNMFTSKKADKTFGKEKETQNALLQKRKKCKKLSKIFLFA